MRACQRCGKPCRWGNVHCSQSCREASTLLPIGSVHGRWTVLEHQGHNGSGSRMVRVQCECGNVRTVQASGLKNGGTRSCGCLRTEVVSTGNNRRTHGRSYTPEWFIFHAAKQRCTNPKHRSFRDYGGRGIEFRFRSFEEFYEEVGPRPSNEHSIDRINNDGHYEPGNVRWATPEQQKNNKRPRRPP